MKTKKKYSLKNIFIFFKYALWAHKEMFRIAKLDTTLIFIFTILLGIVPSLQSYIYSLLTDQILALVQNKEVLQNVLNISQPYFRLLLLSTSIYLFTYTLRRLNSYINYRFNEIHFEKYETELIEKIASFDIKTFEDKNYANLIKKGRENLWKVRSFVNSSYRITINVVNVVISAVIIFNISPYLFIYLFISGLPAGISSFIFSKKRFDLDESLQEEYRKKWSVAGSLINEDRVVQNRVLNSKNFLLSKYTELKDNLNNKELALEKRQEQYGFIASLPYFLSDAISSVFFLSKLLLGNITFGQFNFYLGRASTFADRLDSILSEMSVLYDNALYIGTIKKLFDLESEIVSGPTKLQKGLAPVIEFKNVSFKYPKSKKYAIRNLNITINTAEEIAIVGENGAGKSTFIKLLLRLYEIDEGEILINNVNIKDIDLVSYYDLIGVLFQEYSLYYSLKINENIFIPELKKDEAKFKKALKLAEAEKFINSLEKKDESLISKNFDGGVNLSTGQEQKIALARMFYKDSSILILDEPTASIDPVSEYKIFKRIYKFMTNKTVIIISHRFSTVRNAQKIYVFDKGKIIESGSHSELLKLNGKYADAFNKQAEGYTKEA